MTDLYALLDVPPSAPDAEIRRRLEEEEKRWFYRRNSAPNMDRRHEAERHVQLLEDARRTLLDPVRRREYDRSRGHGAHSGPPSWGGTPGPTAPPAPSWPAPQPMPFPQDRSTRSFPPDPRSGGYPPGGSGTGWADPRAGQLSSPGRRLGAHVLDSLLGIVTLGIGWIIWFLIIAETGRTPGKSLMNMVTVDATTGQPIGFGRMAARELLLKGLGAYIILALTSGFALPLFAWLLWDRARQQLWDKVVTTVVVDT
jgi:uncharacterized RDD family membrane protein YckC